MLKRLIAKKTNHKSCIIYDYGVLIRRKIYALQTCEEIAKVIAIVGLSEGGDNDMAVINSFDTMVMLDVSRIVLVKQI